MHKFPRFQEYKALFYRIVLAYIFYFLLLSVAFWRLFRWQQQKFIDQQVSFQKEQKQLMYMHQLELDKNEKEIVSLKNEKLEAEIIHKNAELASSAMYLVQKAELLTKLKQDLGKIEYRDPSLKLKTSYGPLALAVTKMTVEVKPVTINTVSSDDVLSTSEALVISGTAENNATVALTVKGQIVNVVADASGNASIDLGDNPPKNVIVRAAASEGTADQVATTEVDTDGDGASGLPPIHTRKSCDGSCVGASEWFTHSYPCAPTSRCVPKGRLSGSPLARWYTSERWARENGAASLSLSMKYWRTSGRTYSSMKRMWPMTG